MMLATGKTILKFSFVMCAAAALVACEQTKPSDSSSNGNSSLRNTAVNGDNYIEPSGDISTQQSATPPSPGANWQQPDNHQQSHFVGMVADKPASWIEQPPNSRMEATRFTVPGRDSNPAAEIVVFFFGQASGGTLDANIARWQSQFKPNEDGSPIEPTISTVEAGDGMKVELVEFVGDYMRMGAAFYSPKQHFITAVIDGPQGTVFVRFVGDEATVAPNREAFVDMMKSLREEDTADANG